MILYVIILLCCYAIDYYANELYIKLVSYCAIQLLSY